MMPDQRKYHGKLSNQRVLIFGGSSGLGYAAAEAAIEDGAIVIICSSQHARVQSAIKRIATSYPSAESRISGHACDLSGRDLEQNVKALFEQTGKVDHIIFSAGDDLIMDSIHKISYDRVLQAGQIRFIAPASYAAGMLGMHRGLAKDLAPIRVNLVSPGAIETEMWKWDELPNEDVVEMRKKLGQEGLTGQLGTPEDVAVSQNRRIAGSKADCLIGSIYALYEGPQHDWFSHHDSRWMDTHVNS
jgi:NAD(P)-dependent dehydrogenase (short-subunit alcohol dehydrogenase family)